MVGRASVAYDMSGRSWLMQLLAARLVADVPAETATTTVPVSGVTAFGPVDLGSAAFG